MAGVRIGGFATAPTIGVPYSKVGDGGVGSTQAIWHVPFAGGAPIQISPSSADEVDSPFVDPVGRTRLVYLQRVSGGDLELRIVNADGTGDALIDSGHHRVLDWKPDGSKIMFTTFNTGELHQIFEINPDGTGRTAIYSASVGDVLNRPRYSPDGTQIAFFRNRAASAGDEVWVMDSDGTNDVKVDDIFDGYTTDNAVSWSPDGTQIAYGDGGNTNGGAGPWGHWYVVDADGTGKTDVGVQPDSQFPEAYGTRAMWTPDGSAIIVEQWVPFDTWRLARCEADGSGQAFLSPAFDVVVRPSLFFPNNRLYSLRQSPDNDLESILADGSDFRVEDDDAAGVILLELFE
jgi:hypothetical protein